MSFLRFMSSARESCSISICSASASTDLRANQASITCYAPQSAHGSDTGVFVGCMWLEYGELLTAHGAGGGAFVVTGNGLAFLAGRLSYAFGFTGPCVPTNTGALAHLQH